MAPITTKALRQGIITAITAIPTLRQAAIVQTAVLTTTVPIPPHALTAPVPVLLLPAVLLPVAEVVAAAAVSAGLRGIN